MFLVPDLFYSQLVTMHSTGNPVVYHWNLTSGIPVVFQWNTSVYMFTTEKQWYTTGIMWYTTGIPVEIFLPLESSGIPVVFH